MRKSIETLTAIGLSTVLAACGGSSSSVANISAEGVWSGSSSSSKSFDLLVLENGNYYSIFGTKTGSTFLVSGFDAGTSSINGSAFSANIFEYDSSGTAMGTVTATVVAGTSLSGSATNAAGTAKVTFSATPLSASYSSYNYNTAPANSDLFGNWTGSILDGTSAMISVSTTGGIAGSNGGCTFTGNATPRNSGKNVFDMSLTLGPSPCAYPGQKVTGIALTYVLSNSKRQLLAAMQDSTKAHGYLFFAQR